jgi:hypothetical protein
MVALEILLYLMIEKEAWWILPTVITFNILFFFLVLKYILLPMLLFPMSYWVSRKVTDRERNEWYGMILSLHLSTIDQALNMFMAKDNY